MIWRSIVCLVLLGGSMTHADTLIVEAEDFQPQGEGWKALPWGTNYYAATFANCFLSRKSYLGASETAEQAIATHSIRIPTAGEYLALVRYEAAYRFETRFRLRIRQNNAIVFNRIYGSRENDKIWAFGSKLRKELSWDWGAVENVVWEGHDAIVKLQAGDAVLELVAIEQPQPGARRNVDLVMLTTDQADVAQRIAKESYLPLDGRLTQAGDLFAQVLNSSDSPLSLTFPPCTEHSPYWVHQRTWKPITIAIAPGATSPWQEVGSLLDTLNDGQWNISATGKDVRYTLVFGTPVTGREPQPIRTFADLKGNVQLAYDADTRRTKRIRQDIEVVHELVDYLKQHPLDGMTPKRTLVYGYGFTEQPGRDDFNALIREFQNLSGVNALSLHGEAKIPLMGMPRGYIDVRGVPTNQLAAHVAKLATEGKTKQVAVVSLGDEIGLPLPPANDHAAFRIWLATQSHGLGDIAAVNYSPTAETAKMNPALYYYSKLYGHRYGILSLKERTDILRRGLPNAGIGANFSPHHQHLYIGETHHWISLFREQGMTMPWGEDYIWQVPVASQQVTGLMLDMYRAGVRHQPTAKIHFYVMPHWPGNTPNSWRRQFYTAIGHGAKVLNLFEYRPVQAAYTENHCSLPAMYQEVRRAMHELAILDDLVQDGQVRPASVGLWFSETGDIWNNLDHPRDVAKRALYLAIRHQQVPLDVIVDGDDLSKLKALYLTDANVSRASSKQIAEWVKLGGTLFATAGAGMFDEFNAPNTVLRELLGVTPEAVMMAPGAPIRWEKQDLPFAEPMTNVMSSEPSERTQLIPVYGMVAPVKAELGTTTLQTFEKGGPALVTKQQGTGQAIYCAYLPGLSWLRPAMPKRPVDRGTDDASMAHFLPTAFDARVERVIALPVKKLARAVHCSHPGVESTIIDAPGGRIITLINFTAQPIAELKVTCTDAGTDYRLASGKAVKSTKVNGVTEVTFALDVADALIVRP